jgi:hypothetical protein
VSRLTSCKAIFSVIARTISDSQPGLCFDFERIREAEFANDCNHYPPSMSFRHPGGQCRKWERRVTIKLLQQHHSAT